jgi:hypothetical protein
MLTGSPTSYDLMSTERQKEALDRLVQAAEQSFQEKQMASTRRDWCNPIPAQRKVDTVQAFLKAFHDEMGEETRRRFEREHRSESWFRDWDATPETTGS